MKKSKHNLASEPVLVKYNRTALPTDRNIDH